MKEDKYFNFGFLDVFKMSKKEKQKLLGIVLIITSIPILLINMSLRRGDIDKLWPSFILLSAIILYIFYSSTMKNKNRLSLLFIATFSATSSVPLLILTFTSFEHLHVLWPGFLLAIGIAFLSLYFFGKGKKINLLLSTLIISLSILMGVIYSLKSRLGLAIGVCILIIGAAFLTRGFIEEKEEARGDALFGKR